MATWGTLRYNILQQVPGTNLDVLDGFLNGRYEQILGAADWTGIHARAELQTAAAYLSDTDTCTLTVGSSTVVGVGTAWTDAYVGMKFYRVGDEPVYTVTAVGSATSLTLDRPYEGYGEDAPGVQYASSGYVFMQNVYTLPADSKALERVLDSLTNFPLIKFTPAELDETAGSRAQVGYPQNWTEIEDTAEVIGTPTVHQVELFPPPRFARGMTIEYLRNAFTFDGQNLAQSPLPFISDSCITYGVKADLAADAGKISQAQTFEAKFNAELARMLRVEFTQRRTKPTMRMAPRFWRHRVERRARGYNYGWNNGTN